MDDGGVKLRNRKGNNLLARLEGVLNIHELVVGQLVDGLTNLFADAPVVNKSGTDHEADRQERKT